jgi:RimJ/RimL family protein N-acetyltransferase
MKKTASPPRGSVRLSFPQSIKTPRLVLRVWRPTDAPLLKSAIDSNLAHLKAFMPWARREPWSVHMVEQRIDKFDQRYRADSEWSYAIFSDGEKMLYGGADVRRSTEKGALEIAFWLGQGWTRQGYATEAVKALVDVAMKMPGIQRTQIRCDVLNTTGSAVAKRAGFGHVETIKNHVFEPGVAPRDTMVWEYPARDSSQDAKPKKKGFWARLFGG